MIYSLDPNDAWERHHDYCKARGIFENFERTLSPDSPLDFMEDCIDPEFQRNEDRLLWAALQPKKESK